MPIIDVLYSAGTDKIGRIVTQLATKKIPGSIGIEFKHFAYLAENKSKFAQMVADLSNKMPNVKAEELTHWSSKHRNHMSRLDNSDTCIVIDNVPANMKFLKQAKLSNATVILMN